IIGAVHAWRHYPSRCHRGTLAMGTLVSALRTVARRRGSHVWARIALEQPGINVAGICTVRQGTQPGRNLVGGKPALVDERMALAQHCVVADVAKLGAALDACGCHVALDGGEFERQGRWGTGQSRERLRLGTLDVDLDEGGRAVPGGECIE